MDDKKVIKTMFTVDAVSIVSDTADVTKGEAQTGYEYKFNTSLPELAYAFAGFLKQIDLDEDIKLVVQNPNQSVGTAFLHLLEAYYTKADE